MCVASVNDFDEIMSEKSGICKFLSDPFPSSEQGLCVMVAYEFCFSPNVVLSIDKFWYWIFSRNARTLGTEMEGQVSRSPRHCRPSGRSIAVRGQHAKVTAEQKEDFRRMKTARPKEHLVRQILRFGTIQINTIYRFYDVFAAFVFFSLYTPFWIFENLLLP